MAEDVRRSAEIRRMASQKVAAELVKGLGYESPEAGREAFLNTVDWLDADVVAAGDRASGLPTPSREATPTLPPSTGTEAVNGVAMASEKLSDAQAAKMTELLRTQDPELVKLKLWEMNLPNIGVEAVVSVMSKPQAKEIATWIKDKSGNS